jgi:hypothetical protein
MLRRPLLILDCKGEISAITLRARAKLGPTKVINPWQLLVDTHPHLKDSRFNPIADCEPRARVARRWESPVGQLRISVTAPAPFARNRGATARSCCELRPSAAKRSQASTAVRCPPHEA